MLRSKEIIFDQIKDIPIKNLLASKGGAIGWTRLIVEVKLHKGIKYAIAHYKVIHHGKLIALTGDIAFAIKEYNRLNDSKDN
jgi:hypothetical protein